MQMSTSNRGCHQRRRSYDYQPLVRGRIKTCAVREHNQYGEGNNISDRNNVEAQGVTRV